LKQIHQTRKINTVVALARQISFQKYQSRSFASKSNSGN